jgi:hypothetical protein
MIIEMASTKTAMVGALLSLPAGSQQGDAVFGLPFSFHPQGDITLPAAESQALVVRDHFVSIVNVLDGFFTIRLYRGFRMQEGPPDYFFPAILLELFLVEEHAGDGMLLELLPRNTVFQDIFFVAPQADLLTLVGYPDIGMPAIGGALSDDGPVAHRAVKIPEVRPALVIEGLSAGDPVIIELIIHMHIDLLRFVPGAVIDLKGGVVFISPDDLATLVAVTLNAIILVHVP